MDDGDCCGRSIGQTVLSGPVGRRELEVGAADKAASLMGYKSPAVNGPSQTASISDAYGRVKFTGEGLRLDCGLVPSARDTFCSKQVILC